MRLQTPAQYFAPKPGEVRLRDFLSKLPTAAAQLVSEAPRNVAKFGISLGEIPYNIATGRPTNRTYPGNIRSFQTDAAKTNEDIVAGKQPMRNALKPFYEVPLAAGEVMGFVRPGIAPISRAIKNEMWNMSDDLHFLRNPIKNSYQRISREPLLNQFRNGEQMTQEIAEPYFKKMAQPVTLPFNPQSKLFKLLELLLGNK